MFTGAFSIEKSESKQYRIFDFFSVRLIFVSPNEHQQQYFLRVAKSRLKIPFLVFMNDIKMDHSLKKSTFSFSFILLYFKIANIQFIRMRQPLRQKPNYFF